MTKPNFRCHWADLESPSRIVDRATALQVIRQHRVWHEPITRTLDGYVLHYGPLQFVMHRTCNSL